MYDFNGLHVISPDFELQVVLGDIQPYQILPIPLNSTFQQHLYGFSPIRWELDITFQKSKEVT